MTGTDDHQGHRGHQQAGQHDPASGHGPSAPAAPFEPGPDVVMDRDFWEGFYGSVDGVWTGRPNAQLVTEVAGLTPGTALDVGCGEGGDAVWLARQGWQVTAVDISETALRRGQGHATAAGPEVAAAITWVELDLTEDETPATSYDLVTAHFMHLPSAERDLLNRRLAAAVRPGGSLLVVGHHPEDVHAGAGRWSMADRMFTGAQVASVLDPASWDVRLDEARPRDVLLGDGETHHLRDVVVRARRR